MTLRRGRNGWARKPRRSLGCDFGAWSAATYCVRWLEDTVPRLCAKFGALRRMFNEVSSRSNMNWRMGNHVPEKRFCISKLIKQRLRGVSRTVNWDDSIIYMCQSDTATKLRACKRIGHIWTFQRYFDSWSQQALWLLFITSTELYPWILSSAWWASMTYRRNIGNQADFQKLSRLWFLKMEVESPILFLWRSTRTSHRVIINDCISDPDSTYMHVCAYV